MDKYSFDKTLNTIFLSSVFLVVIDCTSLFVDKKLIMYLINLGKSFVFILNKIDLVKKDRILSIKKKINTTFSRKFIFLCVSAFLKINIKNVLNHLNFLYSKLFISYSSSHLNFFLKEGAFNNFKILSIYQKGVNPLTFFLKIDKKIKENNIRFIKKTIRKELNIHIGIFIKIKILTI